MLVEFRVANFRSFRDEQTLSLVASNDTSLPDNCIPTDRFKLLRTAAVYGPNASGKSNLIMAMHVMKEAVLRSAEQRPSGMSLLSPFLLDTASRDKPSLFEVTVILGATRYQYGFKMSQERIHEEWLFVAPTRQIQKWFQRALDPETGETTWKWSSFFRGERVRLSKLTRPDALFLSVGAQFNHQQLRSLYNWFAKSVRTVPPPTSGILAPITEEMLLRSEAEDSSRESPTREYLLAFLRDADLGIENISVSRRNVKEPGVLDSLPESVKNRVLAEVREGFLLEVETSHRNMAGLDVSFSLEDESDGTQRMFQLAGPWLQAIMNGYTVCVDEIGASLHPLLVRELLRPFQHPEINRKGAQLVFTTHDTTLLDPELLRRDQVWFTEKDAIGETVLRPLSDYKVRKGEAMQKGYLAGRYGAVPVLKAFEL